MRNFFQQDCWIERMGKFSPCFTKYDELLKKKVIYSSFAS
jgi:hypothetical protein